MAPWSLKRTALAALSFCTALMQASPLPAEAQVQPRQASGYKNIVYFTNWYVCNQCLPQPHRQPTD
jgi:chitinase